MRKLRKVLSIILVVSMVLGFSPVSVFAESLAESNVVISETADEPAGTDEQDPAEAVLTDKQADEEEKHLKRRLRLRKLPGKRKRMKMLHSLTQCRLSQIRKQ